MTATSGTAAPLQILRTDALARLADGFRDLVDPGDVAFAAALLLATALDVSRVGCGTIDHDTEALQVTRDWIWPSRAARRSTPSPPA